MTNRTDVHAETWNIKSIGDEFDFLHSEDTLSIGDVVSLEDKDLRDYKGIGVYGTAEVTSINYARDGSIQGYHAKCITSQSQTCPDRMNRPWKAEEDIDKWETDRWSTDIEAVAKKHAEEIAENIAKNGKQTLFLGPHNDEWLWPSDVPRTCSFCGGIHPEDAIRLITEGWEVEPTDKSYKRYLQPPGYSYKKAIEEWSTRRREAMEQGKEPELGGLDDVWSPVPPVKVYVSHFDKDQIERFNKALRSPKNG